MSYTPTTWTTGDTVSASDFNRIEQGIANAGGGGVAVVTFSATGYSSSTKLFGLIAYASYENGSWVFLCDDDGEWIHLNGNAAPWVRGVPLLMADNMYPFLVNPDSDELNTTGGVSDTNESVYTSYGSEFEFCYRITGNGSVEFVSNA